MRTVPTSVGPLRPGDGRLSAFPSRSLPESLAFYADAVSYASLILHGNGISLDDSGDEHELDGFIVNFETMFEDYVRNSISLHAPADWRIEDGNTIGRKPLFDDRPSPPAQPDIVISNSAIRVVVEVKYKEKPDRSDINQALTYALSYGTRIAIILHLCGVGGHAGAYLIGRVGSVSLYGYRLDLGVATMQQQERQLADDLFALAQGPSSQTESTPL
ncbi:MAG: 5-methylcytosine restriction system specificity protein McrC [Pseudomonas sp.]|uniref:5-methylcytosine restriction system specificity protein McrC n=1 Tax=Stenotrophomonas sp. TaxID=69392 RepID=UPI003D6CBCA5